MLCRVDDLPILVEYQVFTPSFAGYVDEGILRTDAHLKFRPRPSSIAAR